MTLRTKFTALVALCTLVLLGIYYLFSLHTAERAILGFNTRSAVELSTSMVESSDVLAVLDEQDHAKTSPALIAKLSRAFADQFFVILEDQQLSSNNIVTEQRTLELVETEVGYQFHIEQAGSQAAIVQVSRPLVELGNRKLFSIPQIVLTQHNQQRLLRQRLSNEFMWALIGLSGVAIFLSWLGAGYFLRPLARAEDGFKHLKAGRLETRLSVERDDEVGQLVKGFNDLAIWLEGLHQQYRQMNNDLAHELRSPLNAVASRLEALEDGVIEPSAAQFRQMRTEIAAITSLVEDLRLLSLTESSQLSLNLQTVSLPPLVEQLVSSYEPVTKIQLTVENSAAEVWADPERTRQILVNLIDNAIRYGSEPISINIRARDNSFYLSVSDLGEGISESDKARVFDRFYRSDSARSDGGLGLGLAISQQLAQLQGGDLIVEDNQPSGATFVLVLRLKV